MDHSTKKALLFIVLTIAIAVVPFAIVGFAEAIVTDREYALDVAYHRCINDGWQTYVEHNRSLYCVTYGLTPAIERVGSIESLSSDRK